MEQEIKSFAVADYIVFAAMLVISAGIGLFFACRGGKQNTTGEYLTGNRNMQVLPVATSILLSYMSAILVLGTPAELYTHGTQYCLYMFGISLGVVLAAVLFVPLLYPLNITSCFEYLEKRFDSRAAKITGTLIMCLQQILYIGVASFAPSTALEAVTGFPTWASIIIVGVVATFYTALGGIQAVVWTDVFQAFVLFAGLLAVLIQGSLSVGGIGEVWRLNDEWKRIDFFDFNPNPLVRHTFWSLVIGGMIMWTSIYGVSQASVQRYCALPTLRKAKQTVMINIIGVVVLMTVVFLCGMTLFAYYAQKGCDPLSAKYVNNPNQLIPYFVMEVLAYPGLPGLFVACLFSGALSSVSSSLNGLSANCWEDLMKPLLENRLSEAQKAFVTKLLVVIFGAAGIGVAFLVRNLGGTILQVSLSFTGAATGPVLGLFLLGALFPWTNWIGAVVGGILGLAFPMWLGIGAYSVIGVSSDLKFPKYNCSTINSTITTSTMMPGSSEFVDTTHQEYSGLSALYTMSYLWYPAIGTTTVVIVGLIVSALTGMNSVGDIDSQYLIPLFDRLFCCLPRSLRRTLRCNQEFDDNQDCSSKVHENIKMEITVSSANTPNKENIDLKQVHIVSFKKKDES